MFIYGVFIYKCWLSAGLEYHSRFPCLSEDDDDISISSSISTLIDSTRGCFLIDSNISTKECIGDTGLK